MKTLFDGNVLYIVMEKGETLARNLRSLAAMQAMRSTGSVITALGLLKNIDLGYGRYRNNEVRYDRQTFAEPLELINLSGFVLKSEAQPFHLHASLGNSGKEVFGGHLFDAEVVTFVEMSLLLSDAPIRRFLKDGLPEMDFTSTYSPGND